MEQETLNNHVKQPAVKPLLAAVGDCVRFTYKGGRKVWGEVLFIDRRSPLMKLKTDYIGRNVEWFAGEEKHFNIKECKNFRLANCS